MLTRQAKVLLIAFGVVVLALGACLAKSWYDDYRFQKSWDKVQAGMTQKEVDSILGKPITFESDAYSRPVITYRVDTHSKFGLSPDFPFLFQDNGTSDEYRVTFSTDGRVAEKRTAHAWNMY